MGKGTIQSGGSEGRYQVQINYDREALNIQLGLLNTKLAEYIIILDGLTDPIKINKIQLVVTSLEAKIDYLNSKIPVDFVTEAWCADLSEELSGIVGVVEVPGELPLINIQPGFEGSAAYDGTRDGILLSTPPMSAAQAYYNLAVLPGWQKWKPTFRYGTITAINDPTVNITLDEAISSQQGLNVNQVVNLSNVPVEYMECDVNAFDVGDSVLIKFEGQDLANPIVVGFKDHPQPCGGSFLLVSYTAFTGPAYCFIWDFEEDTMATKVKDNDGNLVNFPCLLSATANWRARFISKSKNPLATTPLNRSTNWGYYSDSTGETMTPATVCDVPGYVTEGSGEKDLTNVWHTPDSFYTWFYRNTLYMSVIFDTIEYVSENTRSVPKSAVSSFILWSMTGGGGSAVLETETESTMLSEGGCSHPWTQYNCGCTSTRSDIETEELKITTSSGTALLAEKSVTYEPWNHKGWGTIHDWSHLPIPSGTKDITLAKELECVEASVGGAIGTLYLAAYCVIETELVVKYSDTTDPVATPWEYEWLFPIDIVFVLGNHETDANLLNPLDLPKHDEISSAASNLKSTTDSIAGASDFSQLANNSFTTEILE